MWSLAITAGQVGQLDSSIVGQLRDAGVTTIVPTARGWTPARHRQLLSLARRFKLTVVEPVSPPRSARAKRQLRRSCATRSGTTDGCAVFARTSKAALKLARSSRLDFVVRYLNAPRAFLRLFPNASSRTRIIGVVRIHAGALGSAWQRAVGLASAQPATSLAVEPSSASINADLESYLGLISPHSAGAGSSSSSGTSGGGSSPGGSSPGGSSGGSSGGGSGSGGGGTGGGGTGGGGSGGGGTGGGGSSAEVFVSLSGDDSTCVRGDASRPCASFDRAYRIAEQGDVVEVAGGDYPGQTIGYDASKSSAAGGCRLAYSGDGTFAASTAGCVTFEPAPGARVVVGAHAATTADLDLVTDTTIPVSSTSGFVTGSSFQILVGQTRMNCTGATSTSFTGCTAAPACGLPTGGSLCGYDAGTDVTQGSVVVNASYLRLVGITVLGGLSAQGISNPVTDDLFDSVTVPASYINGSYLAFVNSSLGADNASRQDKITSCDHCVVYDSTIAHMTSTHCDEALAGQTPNYYCHGDGIYANGDTNLYLVGNRFYDNSTFQLYFENSFGPSGHVTIANNYFGVGASNGLSGEMSIRGASNQTWDSFTIEGNLMVAASMIGARIGATGVSLTNWLVLGNIFGASVCPTKPSSWSGTFDVRFLNNTGVSECSSSAQLIAAGNETLADVGIGGDGTLWAVLRAHWLAVTGRRAR